MATQVTPLTVRARRGRAAGRYSATMPSDARSGSSSPSEDAEGRRPDDPGPDEPEDPDPRIRPSAAVLLAVEALLLAVVASYCFVMVGAGVFNGRFGLGLGVFFLLFAAGAAVAARSVTARGRFGLGYGLTWQLFQGLIGASLLRIGLAWQGGLAIVLAIAVLVLLTRLVRSTPLPRRGH